MQYSFPTAKESLAEFIVELGLKLKFWNDLVKKDINEINTYWLPAFFEPRTLLQAFIQKKSRLEEIPLIQIKNEFSILEQPFEEMELVPCEENVCYLTGMTIEGAIWDIN